MASSQNFKATVTFGGRVDPSLKRGADELNQAAKAVDKTVEGLTRSQNRLKDKIRATKLAGRDVGALIQQYKKLGRQIEETTADQEKLNQQIAKGERREKIRAGFGKAAGAMGRGIQWGGGAALGLQGCIVAGAVAINHETAEKSGLARSYGMGIQDYSAWDNLAKQAGLNGENAGDLREELTNKLGELGNEKSLNPMLSQINLSKARLTGLSRDQQFSKVMDGLMKLKDEKQAASLADQLMGGESNKILTFMRSTGKTWEASLTLAKKNNLLTQEGADGAVKANMAVTNLWSVMSSGLADTLGKVSGELAPELDKARDSLASWIKEKQPDITDAVKNWMKPDENMKTGPERFIGHLVDFGSAVVQVTKIIWAVAEKLSWLIPDEKNKSATTFDAANAEARKSGMGFWASRKYADDKVAEQVAADKAAAVQKLRESNVGAALSPQAISTATAGRGFDNKQYNKVDITVTGAPGQSPEEVGFGAYKAFKDRLPDTGGSGAMFDIPAAG